MLFHYDTVRSFALKQYTNILLPVNLREELYIKQRRFWFAEKDKKKYLLTQEMAENLPIRPISTNWTTFRAKVYHLIKKYKKLKIRPEKTFPSFKEFVDFFCPFEHENPLHFLLWKLIVLTAYFTRINCRISAPAEFGKDSLVRVLGDLTGKCMVIIPHSLPAIEYRLLNKILAINEIGTVESQQRLLIQEFLLTVGDFSTVYQKSTRGSMVYQTFDEYDISELSLLILMNPYSYYEQVGQNSKFFDRMFTKAVRSRFLPFLFDGTLEISQFRNKIHPTEEDYNLLLKCLRALEYFKQKYHKFDEEPEPDEDIVKGRQAFSASRILKTIKMYGSKRSMLIDEFYDSIVAYREQFTGFKRKRGQTAVIDYETVS